MEIVLCSFVYVVISPFVREYFPFFFLSFYLSSYNHYIESIYLKFARRSSQRICHSSENHFGILEIYVFRGANEWSKIKWEIGTNEMAKMKKIEKRIHCQTMTTYAACHELLCSHQLFSHEVWVTRVTLDHFFSLLFW